MAIKPIVNVPNTLVADAAYPYGSAKNVSIAGAGDGTPWFDLIINDIWGFLQSIIIASGASANNSPDSVTNPQYLTALQALFASASAVQGVITSIGDLESAVGNTNATNMGLYTGTVLTDNQVAKFNIQQIADAVQTLQAALSNASTTVKGVVEQATTAEMFVNPGSPAINGATGARLFMTPRDISDSKLAVGRDMTGLAGSIRETLIQSSSQILIQRGVATITGFGTGGGSVGSTASIAVPFAETFGDLNGISCCFAVSTLGSAVSLSIFNPIETGFTFRGTKVYGTGGISANVYFTAYGRAN